MYESKRVRYKQRDFSLDDIDELKQINWNLEKYGCGPTSIANVLVNLGFKINPIDTAKKFYMIEMEILIILI